MCLDLGLVNPFSLWNRRLQLSKITLVFNWDFQIFSPPAVESESSFLLSKSQANIQVKKQNMFLFTYIFIDSPNKTLRWGSDVRQRRNATTSFVLVPLLCQTCLHMLHIHPALWFWHCAWIFNNDRPGELKNEKHSSSDSHPSPRKPERF